MNVDNIRYYEKDDIWNRAPEPYQVQVLADLLAILPNDVSSILDIGCGDGFITNAVPAGLEVIGVDISLAALKHVKSNKIVSSSNCLPFPDHSFDLVMINDVLEHLDVTTYETTLNEIKRVSKRYIIVTVPYMEDLQYGITICDKCGYEYHVNWHQCSFDVSTLSKLFSGTWEPYQVCFSGSLWAYTLSPFTKIRRMMGQYNEWDHAVCPRCGDSSSSEGLKEDSLQIRLLDSMESLFWRGNKELMFKRPDRSECIVLYRKDTFHIQDKHFFISVNGENLPMEMVEYSQCEIDFSNPEVFKSDHLLPFRPWPAYSAMDCEEEKLSEGMRFSLFSEDVPARIVCSFPVSLESGGDLRLSLETNDMPSIRISIYNQMSNRYNQLMIKDLNINDKELEISIPPGFYECKEGLLIEIYINRAPVIFKRIQLFPINTHKNEKTEYIKIFKGHNIIQYQKNDIVWQYGLQSEKDAYIPLPEWFLDCQNLSIDSIINTIQDPFKILSSILTPFSKGYEKLMKDNSKLNELLEEKERQRDVAEQAYASISTDMVRLNELLEEKERQRDAAEQAYASISHNATRFEKTCNRKIQRVLVFSHMFPHIDQPGLGPFVLEQVQALRKYEGLDVRVISGRPFWISTLNPVKIIRAISYYCKNVHNISWEVYDGVPVLYVPYIAGSVFRFWSHGWTYLLGVQKVLDLVWRSFKFDLVHSHTAYLDGGAGMFAARHFKVPLIITEHTGPFTYLSERQIVRQRTKKALISADKVLAVSQSLKSEICSSLQFENPQKITWLPNGVDINRFKFLGEWHPNPVSPKLLFIGYFVSIKGIDILIKAMLLVLDRKPGAQLKIVGGGEEEESIRQLISDLKLGESVKIMGQVSREEVSRLMREECDIFVLPSHSETFGVVLIEAMACGKPVVATKCGGPESIVTDPSVGELCLPNDPSALALAIIRCIEQLPKYDPIKIRQFAVDRFSFQSIAKRLCALYEEI